MDESADSDALSGNDTEELERSPTTVRRFLTPVTLAVGGFDVTEAPDWIWNYNLMAIFVGVNHGVEDLLFAYTTVVYPGKLGYNCNTLLYLVWCFSSMLIAAPVSAKIGSKASILLGLIFYTIQYIAFVVCSLLGDVWYMYYVAYAGAVSCGIGAGFLWTGEGVYFAQSTQRIVDATGEPYEEKSAQLAAIFGLWSLGIECGVKIGSFILEELGCDQTTSFAIALLAAIGAAIGFQAFTRPVHREQKAAKGPGQASDGCETSIALGAIALWGDARIWLIMFLTVDFTVGSAFVNGIVGTDYVKPQLGSKYIALLSTSIALTGTLVQAPFRCIAQKFGKVAVLAIGSVVLVSMPLLFVVLPVDHLGWGLVTFYILHGVVRGLQAGIGVSLYADHFPEPTTEPAMANMCMQQGVSASLAFFFAARVSHVDLMKIMVGLACCVVPGYLAAGHMQRVRYAQSLSASSAESGEESVKDE